MGRPMAGTNEYFAYEPNSRIAFKSTSGPVPFEASYRLEPAAGGTKVTSTIAMRPTGLMGLMEPLTVRSLKKEMSLAFSQPIATFASFALGAVPIGLVLGWIGQPDACDRHPVRKATRSRRARHGKN